MLRNISPVISPKLLATLFRMGHGDEIVLTDAFFPGDSCGKRVIRADGIGIPSLLEGILPLITLDSYVKSPLFMMSPAEKDELDMGIEAAYRSVVDAFWPETPPIQRVERFKFYDQAKNAYAIVMTGEIRKYANIILKKGVIDR